MAKVKMRKGKTRIVRALSVLLAGCLCMTAVSADTLSELSDQKIAPPEPADSRGRYVGRGLHRALSEAVTEKNPKGLDENEFELMFSLLLSYYRKHPVVETLPYPGIPELLAMLKDKGIVIRVFNMDDFGSLVGVIQGNMMGSTIHD